ncbi:MAG: AI-2E family transporter [Clostridia bacterium]
MKEKKGGLTKWLYWFLFAVAVITVYKTLDNFNDILGWLNSLLEILMPFLIGILIAYLLYLPAKKMEQGLLKAKGKLIRKKARVISIFLTYVIAILILAIIINFVLPTIIESVIELVNNLPGYYSSLTETLDNLPEDSIWNQINAKGIIQNIEQFDFSKFINLESLTGYAKGVINMAGKVFDIFISFVVSVYLLVERTEILNFIKKVVKAMVNKKTYENIGKYFYQTNEIFFRFVFSQLLDGIIVGILTSIAMSLMGVKYSVLLGFMIGLFNLIPYFGAIIAVGIAILVTLFTGGLMQAIWMAIIIIILQQIDANIINPKIVGNSLKISPLLVIFAVTIGGAYFGVLGMFLAVPIVTVLKMIVNDYIDYKNQIKEKDKKIEIEES